MATGPRIAAGVVSDVTGRGGAQVGVVGDVRRFDVHLVDLDPMQGSEFCKARPCVVSPDEMARHVRTVIIAPMAPARHHYPTRIDVTFQRKNSQVVLDQIAAVLVEMFTYG